MSGWAVRWRSSRPPGVTAKGREASSGRVAISEISATLMMPSLELEVPGHGVEIEEKVILNRTVACESQSSPEPEDRTMVTLGLLVEKAEAMGGALAQRRFREVDLVLVLPDLVDTAKHEGAVVRVSGSALEEICDLEQRPRVRQALFARLDISIARDPPELPSGCQGFVPRLVVNQSVHGLAETLDLVHETLPR